MRGRILAKVDCTGLIALAAFVFLTQTASAAGLDADTQRTVNQLIELRQFQQAIALLQTHELDLADDPDFNYLLGITALKAENTGLAQSALERATLQRPSFAGAWLDLALACEANGDLDCSRQALDTFIQRFGSPPALRPVLISLQQRLRQAGRSKSHVSGELAMSLGRDSNANNGFTATSLPLTIGGTVIELPLDSNFQPRPAAFAESTLKLYGQIDGNEALGWHANVRERRYQGERDSDLGDRSLGITMHHGLSNKWQSSFDVSFQNVQLGMRRLFNETRISAQAEHSLLAQGCNVALGSELENRTGAPAEGIAANLYWLYGGLACRSGLLPGLQWTGLARLGLDQPSDERAGGQTQRQEMFLQVGLPLGRLWLESRWQWTRAADQQGYSDLIANNARRTLTRNNWQLALATPLTVHIRGDLSLERMLQHSNIALFDQSNTTIKLGLSYVF